MNYDSVSALEIMVTTSVRWLHHEHERGDHGETGELGLPAEVH
jgi:hypothetical protein